jgi:hypothetical protein
MLERLLLVAQGGANFVAPVPAFDVTTLLAATEAGGWTEANADHATYGNGTTYVGWVGGNSKVNDIEIAAYDHDSQTWAGPVLLHDNLNEGSSTSPDSHNGPAVLIRDDGHLIVAYVGHNAAALRVKISNDPWDIVAGFGSPITAVSGGEMTYPMLAQLGSRIYMFWRDRSGAGARLESSYSDDGGATWSSVLNVFDTSADFLYQAFAFNSTRIDIAVTDKEPDAGDYGLWHFYMEEDGSVFKSDGTEITGFSYPLAESDLTEIMPTGNDHYPYALSYTDDGRPVIAWQTKAADPVEFGEHRWTGSAWTNTTIDTSDPISPSVLSVGGGCHFWNDSERFITAKMTGGELQLFGYLSSDDGATWSSGAQLGDFPDANSPVHVRDGQPDVAALAFDGLFASNNFDPALLGIGY